MNKSKLFFAYGIPIIIGLASTLIYEGLKYFSADFLKNLLANVSNVSVLQSFNFITSERVLIFAVVIIFLLLKKLHAHNNNNNNNNVAIIFPQNSPNEFFTSLITNLAQQLRDKGYVAELKVLSKDPKQSDFASIKKELLANKRPLAGGIIIPTMWDAPNAALKIFEDTKISSSIPFVIADTMRESISFEMDRVVFTAFDGDKGGEIAGGKAVEYVKSHLGSENSVNILICHNAFHDIRVKSFKKQVTESPSANKITLHTTACAFNPIEETYKGVTASLEKFRIKGAQVHLIYCINHEITLAAERACLDFHPSGSIHTKIIGYDSSQVIMEKIRSDQSPIIATVSQDTNELANMIIDSLDKLMENKEADGEDSTNYKEPVLVWA